MTASKERKIKEQAQRIAELSAALEIERDHCNQGVAEAQVMARHIARLYGRVEDLEKQKDGAYAERNNLVAALARLFPSSLERHPEEDESWENDWRWIVFIDLPTGQASWHIHDSELEKFSTISRFAGRTWDGHTTEQKYQRLAAMPTATS